MAEVRADGVWKRDGGKCQECGVRIHDRWQRHLGHLYRAGLSRERGIPSPGWATERAINTGQFLARGSVRRRRHARRGDVVSAGKGSAFERLVVHDMESRGWLVTRASNSKGIADVWAVCAADVALIECKAGRNTPDVDQWNQLYHAAMTAGAVPVVAMRRNGRLRTGQARIRYMRMTGPKTGGVGVRPPWDDWSADEPTAHAEAA